MSGGDGHGADPGEPLEGPAERLPAEAKLLGALAFLIAVVVTPSTAWWAFGVQAAVVAVAAVAALVPLRSLARRLVIEVPFVALAAAMGVAGGPPTRPVGPLTLSGPGLDAAGGMLARATLGVLAASLVAATTPPGPLIGGLRRLRVPALLVTLTATGLRYAVVLRGELDRMRLAQELRNPDRRRNTPATAAVLGAALFVRAYERGERVHTAMAARGGITPHAAAVTTAPPVPAPGPTASPAPGTTASPTPASTTITAPASTVTVEAGGRTRGRTGTVTGTGDLRAPVGSWFVALTPAAVAALTAAVAHLAGVPPS